MTQVSLKQVNAIIDSGILAKTVVTKDRERRITKTGLLYLKLVFDTSEMLTREGRERVIRMLEESPRRQVFQENGVRVDVRAFRSAVNEGLSRLRQARGLVARDPDILGGTTCIKGTRIPVHDVAALVAAKESMAAIRRAYPRLSKAQIELAALYAEAYPRRGRPRRKPAWHKSEPVSSKRVALKDMAAAP
ncbi:MAG: DUF433 domain-containing protein [Rhodospirillales bacterium]|nr:DUF433 domain-containing protein [Rhodospirillales bacterium]